MKYLYAKFKGYIGFYNGLGLDTVEIDFSKCKHNIVLIIGKNGSGKSTLMDHLNVFPDPSSSFVPDMNSEKILRLVDNNTIYDILISSPADTKGGRKQTKAFIKKNGLELNPNGNISSYKSIIFSEFELDSNYISLSKLSSNDRGLGDKTPAERKKFASTVVDNLEVYNEMYKSLNKRSIVFKSHLNTLHTKIQNVGIKENLEKTLRSLKNEEGDLNTKILELNNRIVSIETKFAITVEESEKIQKLQKQLYDINAQIINIETSLKGYYKSKFTINNFEEFEKKYKEEQELLKVHELKVLELSIEWTTKSKRLTEVSESLQSMEAELVACNNNIDITMEKKYNDSNMILNNIIDKLKKYNIPAVPDLLYKAEELLRFYKEFINYIDSLYDRSCPEMLQYICIEYNPNDIDNVTNQINNISKEILSTSESINELQNQLKEISILDEKPKDCNNANCPFISKALKLEKQIGGANIIESISTLQNKHLELSTQLTQLSDKLVKLKEWSIEKRNLDQFLSKILTNKNLFEQFNDIDMIDIINIYKKISMMNTFNNQRDPRRITDICNTLKELKTVLEINTRIKYEYQSYKEKIKIIKSTKSMIDKMTQEKDSLIAEVGDLRTNLSAFESIVKELRSELVIKSEFNNLAMKYKEKQQEKSFIESQLEEFNDKSNRASEEFNYIINYKANIENYNNMLVPIKNEIQRISGQLSLLESYYTEYNMYKEKYDMINTIKKYCSPTGEGIQTLFMQLYMVKTLDLANQVLGMLFGGEYKLLDFIINQKEFRIPFVGSGLPVDDISSGSTSQICIMGMIINLVLLHQASTKFNIARLDEIDGGLDHRNRFGFVSALYSTMNILEIDQLFIISHSLEADTSNVDIIKLKSYDDFDEGNSIIGNVIYDYNEQIKH